MIIKRSLLAACFAATAVNATLSFAAEEKYPAWNFEPTVIFSNAELIEKTHGAVASVGSSSPTVVAATVHEVDPKYPAAYFNPTILYPAR